MELPDADPGTVVRGTLDATDLPTGGTESLPVVVAEGTEPGPTLWLTGGVHGDEATGVAVAQDAVRADLPERLRGTVVSVPVVNPAGVRRNSRVSYYGDDDPNRYFPDPGSESESPRPPEVQERIDSRLYDLLVSSADALIDLHTAQIGSVPFSIRDRVLYGDRREESTAAELAEELSDLVSAFGLPVVTEYPTGEYLDQSLQRSTAGAVLNGAGIPAFTAELGGHSVVDSNWVRAGVAGVYGVLAHLEMVDSVPSEVADPGAGVPDAPVEFPVRRFVGPRTEVAGLVRHRAAPGDAVESGQVVAEIVGPAGESRGTVESEYDGYVLGLAEGLAVYEGDPVASMAVRDDDGLVGAREE
ncbi:succinylglutamate desuccinylase/aspartoacylase family protein [Salinirubrum litoreum]|uniref:Succinylglutamate desuccinylase/aspartoacylase family protein n=1 Tax=Salinirubrum litoreum TaxID=1126234 RepID=A0ABD5RBY9_9EURY|nr:succinylglutamate desuccinylase/aspartoacylase family protein [Salinirubrum litoreum]